MDTETQELIASAADAKVRMQAVKQRNRASVRHKYEGMARREIADLNAGAEAEFAGMIAKLHDAGVPQGVIRKEVLRTNTWGVWVYWRDLAGIPPARGGK